MDDLIQVAGLVIKPLAPLIFVLSAIIVADKMVGLIYNAFSKGGRRT